MSVIVMLCFARSGGTILNQCLASLPNVVMLSEVNPVGIGTGKKKFHSIKHQVKDWYGIDIKSTTFLKSILELEKICETSDKKLIVRDWPFVNFAPNPTNRFDPAGKLLTLEALKGKCKIIPFALVRDSIDVWLSCRSAKIICHSPIEEFFYYYLQYVNAVVKENVRIFKYETFCERPDHILTELCEYIGLQYSPSFRKYYLFDNVCGDIQIAGGSRGGHKNCIVPLSRRQIGRREAARLNNCREMIDANTMLGYPVSYYDRPREGWFGRVAYKLGRLKKCVQELCYRNG